jgi:hypothetical protein
MPDEDTAEDRAEAQRLLSEARMRKYVLPWIQEERYSFWDRAGISVRSDPDVSEFAKDHAWLRSSRQRSDMLGKRLFSWLTAVGTVIAVLAGLIDIYLKVKGK